MKIEIIWFVSIRFVFINLINSLVIPILLKVQACKLKKQMIAHVFQKYPENPAFQLYIMLQFTHEICNFLKK